MIFMTDSAIKLLTLAWVKGTKNVVWTQGVNGDPAGDISICIFVYSRPSGCCESVWRGKPTVADGSSQCEDRRQWWMRVYTCARSRQWWMEVWSREAVSDGWKCVCARAKTAMADGSVCVCVPSRQWRMEVCVCAPSRQWRMGVCVRAKPSMADGNSVVWTVVVAWTVVVGKSW